MRAFDLNHFQSVCEIFFYKVLLSCSWVYLIVGFSLQLIILPSSPSSVMIAGSVVVGANVLVSAGSKRTQSDILTLEILAMSRS